MVGGKECSSGGIGMDLDEHEHDGAAAGAPYTYRVCTQGRWPHRLKTRRWPTAIDWIGGQGKGSTGPRVRGAPLALQASRVLE